MKNKKFVNSESNFLLIEQYRRVRLTIFYYFYYYYILLIYDLKNEANG